MTWTQRPRRYVGNRIGLYRLFYRSRPRYTASFIRLWHRVKEG